MDSFSEIEILKTAVPEDEPAKDVAVKAIGIDASKYTVSGQTVIVTHDKACKVAYLDGEAYKAVAATKIKDGKYNFTVPDGVDNVILVVKGDADGDGEIGTSDKMMISKHMVAVSHKFYKPLNALEFFALDLDGDGAVDTSDKILLSKSLLSASHKFYKALEW